MTSLERQIRCVERELEFRKKVYPKRVMNDRMTQKQMDEEIDVMDDVLKSLFKLKQPELPLAPDP